MSLRLQQVLDALDAFNREDPASKELPYARQLTDWVMRLNPNASEALRIAARGQHVRRWTIPRSRYPMNRQGYLRWRETLKTFHADTVAGVMRTAGYGDPEIERVRRLMSKRELGQDAETQTLEDALCLVFLESQFAELRAKTPDEKMLEVLRKTWKKMSGAARAEAMRLPLGPAEQQLIKRALSSA